MLGRYHPFPPFHSQGLKSLFCNALDYSIQFFLILALRIWWVTNQFSLLLVIFLLVHGLKKWREIHFLVTPGSERVIKRDKCGAEQLCNEVAVTFCREGWCGEAATLFQAACMSKGQIQGLLFGVNFWMRMQVHKPCQQYPTSIRTFSYSELTLISIPIENRLKCFKGKINGWDEVWLHVLSAHHIAARLS